MSIGSDQLCTAIAECRRFIGRVQLQVMLDACRGEEGEWFKQKIVALAQDFAKMPKVGDPEPDYETRVRALEEEGLCRSDAQGVADAQDMKGTLAHLHYFVGSADWYIVERDCEEEQLQAYGYADLFGDSGEFGYISLVEITRCGAELDLHFKPRPIQEIVNERRRS